MNCAMCSSKIKGTAHTTLLKHLDGTFKPVKTCTRCYNQTDNMAEALMKKQKADKKAEKKGEVRPCAKCGRKDFGTDQARRAHQGRCLGTNPPPALEKPKAKPKKEAPKPPGPRLPPLPDLGDVAPEATDATVEVPEEGKKKRTPSQVGRGSKQKGNKFENDVKKFLATWWGEPEATVGSKASAFQRAPGSGGMSPTNWPLDLHVPEDFPWAVECKNREGTTHGFAEMERFFTSENYQVVSWFKTAEEELVAAGIKKPLLLVFTKNFFPILAAFRRPYMDQGDQTLFVQLDCPHLTLCDRPFGEIVIAPMDALLSAEFGRDFSWWMNVYKLSRPDSWLPRHWVEAPKEEISL